MSGAPPAFEGTADVWTGGAMRLLLPALAVLSTAVFFLDRGSWGLPLIVFVSGFGRGRATPKPVRVDAAGLWIGGALAVARADVRDAWIIEPMHAERAVVHVGTARGASRVLGFADPAEARAFVAGLVPAPGTVTCGSVAPSDLIGPFLPTAALLAVGALALEASALGMVMMITLGVFAWRILRAARLVVGRDGFEIATPLGRRFVPYAEVETLHESSVVLRGGERISLDAKRFTGPSRLARTARRALHARGLTTLHERFASYQAERARATPASASETPAVGVYREAAESPEALVARVASAATEPAARVRIAEALAREGALDVDQHARLRVAISETADPAVRQQLEEALALEGATRRME